MKLQYFHQCLAYSYPLGTTDPGFREDFRKEIVDNTLRPTSLRLMALCLARFCATVTMGWRSVILSTTAIEPSTR